MSTMFRVENNTGTLKEWHTSIETAIKQASPDDKIRVYELVTTLQVAPKPVVAK